MKNIQAEQINLKNELIDNDTLYYPIILSGDGTTFEITNNGTAAAPCCLTIIPMNDVMKMTIQGLTDEVVSLKPIKKDQVVVLDGINRMVSVDGQEHFDMFDGWEFPKLQPGVNRIKIPHADMMQISIAYQPRYI